jgi:hypothetical protein
MVADVGDWTKPVTLTTGGALGADFPDWTLAVEAVGGSTGGYASLTGSGETVTPGNLTQAGGFAVSSTGSNPIELDSTGGGGITLDEAGGTTTGGVAITAGSTNGLYLEGQGGAVISAGSTTPGPFYGAGGEQLLLFASTSIQLTYSYLTTPGTPGDNCVTIGDGSSGGTAVHLYTFPGSPNGHIDAISSGDICFDPTTPALWICTVGGTNNNWHAFTHT